MSIAKHRDRRLEDIRHSISDTSHLSAEEEEEKYLCEQSYLYFIKVFWPILVGRPLVTNLVVEALASHLEALYHLWIQFLLINIPFRSGKSQICSVLYTPWIWTQNANMRFLYAAADKDLVNRDSRRSKEIIGCEKYQKYWGVHTRLKRDANRVTHFENVSGGYRATTSVRSNIIGRGADIRLADDPNSVQRAESPTTQKETFDWFDNAFSSRFEDLNTSRLAVVQQRVSRNDLSAHILSRNHPKLVHLCLPMEYVPEKKCSTLILPDSYSRKWEDPRTERGESICPVRFNEEGIKEMKFNFGNNAYQISCQMQQDPVAPDGGIIREEWFRYYEKEYYPHFKYVIQSWDTAMSREADACYSACSTWGVFEDKHGVRHIMLVGLVTDQLEFPDLRKLSKRLWWNWDDCFLDEPLLHPPKRSVNHVLIEKQVSGLDLYAELFRSGIPVLPFYPRKYGKKEVRAKMVTDLYQNGQVWLPCVPHKSPHQTQTTWHLTDFARAFLEAAVIFPANRAGADTNDIVDSMSQALIFLKENNWIHCSNKESLSMVGNDRKA